MGELGKATSPLRVQELARVCTRIRSGGNVTSPRQQLGNLVPGGWSRSQLADVLPFLPLCLVQACTVRAGHLALLGNMSLKPQEGGQLPLPGCRPCVCEALVDKQGPLWVWSLGEAAHGAAWKCPLPELPVCLPQLPWSMCGATRWTPSTWQTSSTSVAWGWW